MKHNKFLNRVAANNIHVAIARKTVLAIASNPQNRCMLSCLEIVNTGYRDTIMQDIEQSVFLEIAYIHSQGMVAFDTTGRLSFGTEISFNRKGDICYKSTYVRMYKAVYKCLGTYSNNNYVKNPVNYGLDLTYTNENNTDCAISNKASNYRALSAEQWDGGLIDLIDRADVHDFFTMLKARLTTSRFHIVCSVFQGMVDGLSYKDIAINLHITEDNVKKTVSRIRKMWHDNYYHVSLEKQPVSCFGGTVSGTITTLQETSYKGHGLMVKTDNNSLQNARQKNRKFYMYNVPVSVMNRDIYRKQAEKSLKQYELMENYGLYNAPDNNPVAHKPVKVYSIWNPYKGHYIRNTNYPVKYGTITRYY